MAFDIYLQGFVRREAAQGDGDAAMRVLAPFISERTDAWARVVTIDGEADVYGLDQPSSGFMFNHASDSGVWDLVVALARVAGFAVMPVGCPTSVVSVRMLSELPPELAAGAIVVVSGEGLRPA